MKFGFNSLFIDCIHKPEFTNAIQQNSCFQLSLLQTLHDYSEKSWKTIKKESDHWHFVKENDRRRLGNYLKMSDQEIDNLILADGVYQIAIEEEGAGRGYGILKEFGNDHLFDFLFFDPNHLFHYNSKKSQYPSESEAKCIMQTKNCDKVWTVKWKKPKLKKKKN